MKIRFDNVSYSYRHNTPYEIKALSGINLEIERGEFFGIVGPAGSGKTTLLELFNGLLLPDSGKVYIDGKDTAGCADMHKKVGLLLQYPEEQFFADTVYGEIAYGPGNLGREKREIDTIVRRVMDEVGLDFALFRGRSPFSLSNGEMRRCAIASLLGMDASVLVFDEPFAGLDREGERRIAECIEKLKASGRTIVCAARRMDSMLERTGRMACLDEGKIKTI